jgi:hypothetical protein
MEDLQKQRKQPQSGENLSRGGAHQEGATNDKE